MEPEDQSNSNGERTPNLPVAENGQIVPPDFPEAKQSAPKAIQIVVSVFLGSQGLRAGWSIAVFFILFLLFGTTIGWLFGRLHERSSAGQITVRGALTSELVAVLALIGAAWVVAFIERRSILDFNLRGARRTANFLSGIAAGFLVLSALVAALWSGGWLHFGPVSLSGADIAKYALLWGITFLLVGCFEEGLVRCYLQFTLTRGINFWWAICIQVFFCATLIHRAKGEAARGVYAMMLLGLVPCFILHLKRNPNSGFWQAAWVTSTMFGFMHVGNSGENWIGIFAAAAIGLVFCVSIWQTGSAWWAIGCHAGWDWGETYFYGTADSGMVAQGHYMSTSPAGNTFWSGGTIGPEGSILVLGAILLLLLVLLVQYRRKPVAPEISSPLNEFPTV
jgi:membrane protease YdiL (CAAX protease family)